MSDDAAVKREALRVQNQLDVLQAQHTSVEAACDQIGTPKPKLKVCPSCFAREDKPHRDKCEVVAKEQAVAAAAAGNPDVAALMDVVRQQQEQIAALLTRKKIRTPRKKKETTNGTA